MSKETVTEKNRDRFIRLGIVIASVRKLKGLSQAQLAKKAGISRSHLSAIEAPGVMRAFSLDVLYNISDALGISPGKLIDEDIFQDLIDKNRPHY